MEVSVLVIMITWAWLQRGIQRASEQAGGQEGEFERRKKNRVVVMRSEMMKSFSGSDE